MRGLEKRVAIVTGAAGGIGREICRRFIEEGANVVAMDVNADALKQLTADLGADEARLFCVAVDITDYAKVKDAVERGAAKFGKLDVLVNNAGWDVAAPFLKTEPDLWDKIIAINLKGPLNLHKAALPHLIAGGGGKVVNVVCPGPTDTALLRSFVGDGEYGQKIYDGLKRAIPLKRLGQPEDIPGLVAFLSSDDANFMIGQVISVSGGLTMNG